MTHGKAIYSHADEEGNQPLLAQLQGSGQLFLSIFDQITQRVVTIETNDGAESFLRNVADMIDPEPRVSCEEVRLKADLRALAAEHEVLTGGRDREISRLNNELARFQNLLLNAQDDKSVALSEVDNLTQAWGDSSNALREAQQLLADLNQMLTGYPPEPLLVRLREYVQSHGTIATGEIPF